MIDFKVDPEDPRLLHTAIAYDIELVDEMERILELSFLIADIFISKVYEQKEESNDNV